MTRYARDVSATQYENSYDDFLCAIGWALRPFPNSKKKILKDVGFEIVFSVKEERDYLLPNYEAWRTWWEADEPWLL